MKLALLNVYRNHQLTPKVSDFTAELNRMVKELRQHHGIHHFCVVGDMNAVKVEIDGGLELQNPHLTHQHRKTSKKRNIDKAICSAKVHGESKLSVYESIESISKDSPDLGHKLFTVEIGKNKLSLGENT